MQILVESIAPQEGMPVEPIPNRPYSAVDVARQYALEDAPTELVFVVNGKEKSRMALVLMT